VAYISTIESIGVSRTTFT